MRFPRRTGGQPVVPLALARTCELHVHVGGCLHLEDLLFLARDVHDRVDWTPFTNAYERAFGARPDVPALFGAALDGRPQALDALRRHYVVDGDDAGRFDRFQAKLTLAICLYR
ncbi:MAG: hypothetical protein AB1505_13190 [Candidatus Latescibacterota bacterium]